MSFLLYFVLAYIGFFTVTDWLEYKIGIPVWNQTKRTATCYDWFEHYLGPEKLKFDYSEGVFDDYSNTLEEATLRKYEYIFDKLLIKPGMKLLDAGCGTGVWMDYCHKRGVEVIGLTLSEEQTREVRKKGLEAYTMDYRVHNESFLNKFDRITALGSSEHVCSSVGSLNGKMASTNCNKVRIAVWKNFYDYLKEDGKVYITTLTFNENHVWSLWDWVQVYFLERHYGGYYSTMSDITNYVVPYIGFTLSDVQDKTKDYHWSSIVNKDHFGHWTINWTDNTGDKISYFALGLISDPFLLHRWIYYLFDTWMWQFGGYQTTPLSDEQIAQVPVVLKYFMLEKNPKQRDRVV